MPNELNRRLTELEAEIEQLKSQQAYQAAIIHALQEKLQSNSNIPFQPETETKPKHAPTMSTIPRKPISKPIVPKPPKEPIDYEKLIGQVWLPRIFIIVLLIGVLWGFKAAADYGFINEPVKILLGFLASLVFIIVGERQLKANRNALGQVLLGGSVAILLFSTFAMHMLYGMVSATIAFPLNLLWIGLGVYFSIRHRSEALAILSSVAGYFVPFLIESTNPNLAVFVAIETILYTVFLTLALHYKYQILYLTSFFLLHLTFGVAYLALDGESSYFVYGAVVQHLALLVYFLRKEHYLPFQMGTLFTSFVLVIGWISSAFSENVLELFALGLTAFYAGLSFYLWKRNKERLATALSISSFAFMVFLLSAMNSSSVAGLLLVEGILSIFLGVLSKTFLQKLTGFVIYFFGVLVTVSSGLEEVLSAETVNWLLLILSLLVIRIFLQKYEWKNVDIPILMRVVLLAILGTTLLFLSLLSEAFTSEMTTSVQLMTMSFVWAVYAVACIIAGQMRAIKEVRYFGIALLLLTVVKLIFVDLFNVSMFIRAILFITLGVIGILVSRLFYNRK